MYICFLVTYMRVSIGLADNQIMALKFNDYKIFAPKLKG